MNVHTCTAALLLLASSQLQADEQEALFEAWLDKDIDEVNEGALEFIPAVTDRRVLTTEVWLTISEQDMHTGMVDMQQCYSQLDPAAELDIVYSFSDIEALRVTETSNIGSVTISGQTLQLQDIESDARLCASARVKVLEKTSQQTYRLRYGPWFRRFLDGYYPYHVMLQVSYPVQRLAVTGTSPPPQQDLVIDRTPGRIAFDAWFEGILDIEIVFSSQ